ncbi:NUDIX domain-containing protein [Paracoccus sp. DMF-8]|uniref:NUDIX domain-containing protein n=1 Tax=Paracoccus sp. DMF-8 TaxID=3019445 RepID=UPI0023E823AA|nr:NUDIX domain-containing protein [Paracoccus sp. DMF-8]MDF3605302.1 NUDIX domain-containing protein [Paracoccus sp. DMF-8]
MIAGPLAHPEMMAALNLRGEPCRLSGRLIGGARAGIALNGWPRRLPGAEDIPALRVEWTAELCRYAEIFDLTAQDGVLGLGAGPAAGDEDTGQERDWNPQLAAAMAAWLVGLDIGMAAERIRARLPSVAGWVASRLRGESEPQTPLGPTTLGPGGGAWELLSRSEPYAHFFSVESLRLRHSLNSGGWSDPLERAVFVSGDATVLLPWDPVRDRVLLIDQFRAGPAARGDREPWLYEAIAGRVDAGEAPEAAARREAVEEAGIAIGQVFSAPAHYPSPGAVAEFLYLYIGIADLPDGAAGIAGLASEDEDIRSHLVSRSALMDMVDSGRIRNGPLLVLALWLDRHADRLRAELETGANGAGPVAGQGAGQLAGQGAGQLAGQGAAI